MMMKLEEKVGKRESLHNTMWLLAGVVYVEVKLRLVVSVTYKWLWLCRCVVNYLVYVAGVYIVWLYS